ncbi:MAG: YihY/virulence factor BrkB family protein, partial [Opitutales bacterium]|nr:YihY/virulence factor BrkB family protein [Opitutales bacterium]
MIQKAKTFLTTDVWRMRDDELPRGKAMGLLSIRVLLQAFKGFSEDKCSLSASALTFFTLLSIVPLFAMAFGIAQGFGLEQLLEDQISAQIQGQEEVITYIMDFSKKMLD